MATHYRPRRWFANTLIHLGRGSGRRHPIAGELDAGLDGSKLAGAAFNLGNTEEVSIAELAELCLHITGSDSEIITKRSATPRFQKKNHIQNRLVPSVGHQQSLEEGLSSAGAGCRLNNR